MLKDLLVTNFLKTTNIWNIFQRFNIMDLADIRSESEVLAIIAWELCFSMELKT